MFSTMPSASSGSARANSCVSTKGARRFGSRCRSQLSRVTVSHSSRSNALALLTSTPSGPSASVACGMMAPTACSSRRSASIRTVCGDVARSSFNVCSATASHLRQCSATANPASASASAIALPRRLAAPVTSAARGIAAGILSATRSATSAPAALHLRRIVAASAGTKRLGRAVPLGPQADAWRRRRLQSELQRLQPSDLVAQAGGRLEFEIGRGGAHPLLQLRDRRLEVLANELGDTRILHRRDGDVVLLEHALQHTADLLAHGLRRDAVRLVPRDLLVPPPLCLLQ